MKVLSLLLLCASLNSFANTVEVSSERDNVLVEFTGEAAKKLYDKITYRPNPGMSMFGGSFSYKMYIKIGKDIKCVKTDYSNMEDVYKCGISVDYKGRVDTPNKPY